MSPSYERLRFQLPGSLEEALVAALWAHGTLGLESRDVAAGGLIIDAWFEAGAATARDFAAFAALGIAVSAHHEPAQDYLAAYRAQAVPFAIGRRFVIDPGDPPAAAARHAGAGARFHLVIPARVAFGTGSHETTRLMLESLEALDLDGRAVLDVGTGSGILALAALRLGAAAALGFDLDAPSVLVAASNVALNPWSVAPTFFAGRLDALKPAARFDVVLVNVLPERIRGEQARIARTLEPGGILISAGALVSDRDAMAASWAAVGLSVSAERSLGEWICFVLAQRPA